jgi:hypothetical protein
MAADGKLTNAQLNGTAVRYLIIVAHSETELCGYLAHHYGHLKGVQVLPDRRQKERRQRVQAYEPERRRADRRAASIIAGGFRRQPFVISIQY